MNFNDIDLDIVMDVVVIIDYLMEYRVLVMCIFIFCFVEKMNEWVI